MEISQELLEQLIHKEIKEQVSKRLDKILINVVEKEVKSRLDVYDMFYDISKEVIIKDKDLVRNIAEKSSKLLFNKLIEVPEDDYDDEW